MAVKRIRRKKELMEVDITSLLDILVILLFFLLQSYNTSEVKLKVPDKLTLAMSKSKDNATKTTVLQITKNKKVFIDNKEIGSIYNKKAIRAALNNSKLMNKDIKNKNINLVFDQNLPYKIVKDIMNSASNSGFSNFHFIVQEGGS